MKPRFKVWATALAALPLLASCGLMGKGSSGDQATYWNEFTGGGEGAANKQIVKAFNDKYPDNQITSRAIANDDFFSVMRTGMAGSKPPDVLQYEGYQQTRDFAKAGKLKDLTSFWNKHKSQFLLRDSAERACSYQGKIYCLPYTFHSGWQVYYNADLLKKHGIAVPKTYDEFLAAGRKLKQAGVTPIAIGAKDGWPAEHWWMAFIVQRCGVAHIYDVIEHQGGKFTDECFVKGAADLAALAKGGYFSSGAASDDYGTSVSLFRSQKAAFLQTGTWFVTDLLATPPKFKAGIMPIPTLDADNHPNEITGAVTHVFGVSSKAAHPDTAMKFLDFLVSDKATTMWAKHGLLSLVKGAVDQHGPAVMQGLWHSVTKADASLPWMENELPPGVGEDKIYNGTTAVVAGRMTPQQFTEQLQKAFEAAS